MNPTPPTKPLRAWELVVIMVLAFLGLDFGIPAYFSMMPYADRTFRLVGGALFRVFQ